LLENGKRVLEDGTRRLELIDIGPNPHARGRDAGDRASML
jgi:hypothetical protein